VPVVVRLQLTGATAPQEGHEVRRHDLASIHRKSQLWRESHGALRVNQVSEFVSDVVRHWPSNLGAEIDIVEVECSDLPPVQLDQVFVVLKCRNLDGTDPGSGPGVLVDFVHRDNVDRVSDLVHAIVGSSGIDAY